MKTDLKHILSWYGIYKAYPGIRKFPEYQCVIELTKFLDFLNPTFPQRIWHLRNQNFEIQRCKICRRPLRFMKGKYHSTCSMACNGKWMQTHEFKNKITATCLERYGTKHYSQTDEFKKRFRDTNLERYGVENYVQTDEYKQRYETTCLEKYGVENYFQSDECKQKIKTTNLEKYGVESVSQSTHMLKKYGWFKLLEQGIGDAIYIEHIDYRIYLLECKLCGQRFEYNSNNGRIFRGHILCPMCNPVEKFYSSAEKELLSFISSIYDGEIVFF